MSNAKYFVIRIIGGGVKDVASYDYSEPKAVLSTFTNHVATDATAIFCGNTNYPRFIDIHEIEKFCKKQFDSKDGLPTVFWGDNNSIQTVLKKQYP